MVMYDVREETLIEIGLTRNEARVYMALLRLGQTSPLKLSKATGVHRVNVYDVLEKLRYKGLVKVIGSDRKRQYTAEPPRALMDMLNEKVQLLERIIPQLEEFKH